MKNAGLIFQEVVSPQFLHFFPLKTIKILLFRKKMSFLSICYCLRIYQAIAYENALMCSISSYSLWFLFNLILTLSSNWKSLFFLFFFLKNAMTCTKMSGQIIWVYTAKKKKKDQYDLPTYTKHKRIKFKLM